MFGVFWQIFDILFVNLFDKYFDIVKIIFLNILFDILHGIWFGIPSGTLSGISNIYLAYFWLYHQTKCIGFYLVYLSVFFLIFCLVHCREFFRGSAVRLGLGSLQAEVERCVPGWGAVIRIGDPHWGWSQDVVQQSVFHFEVGRDGRNRADTDQEEEEEKKRRTWGGRSTPLIKSDNTHPAGKKMSILEFLQGRCPKTVCYW